MNKLPDDPCPYETAHHINGVTAVDNTEKLAKIIVLRDHLSEGQDGKIELTTVAISKSDISGKKDPQSGLRSVSAFRLNQAPKEELVRRAMALNRVPEWIDDPLLAIADVVALRLIKDDAERREVCVYADPTGEEDRLGACSFHAAIRRSCNPPVEKDRLAWGMLRSKVAQHFAGIFHVCSDTAVTADTLK